MHSRLTLSRPPSSRSTSSTSVSPPASTRSAAPLAFSSESAAAFASASSACRFFLCLRVSPSFFFDEDVAGDVVAVASLPLADTDGSLLTGAEELATDDDGGWDPKVVIGFLGLRTLLDERGMVSHNLIRRLLSRQQPGTGSRNVWHNV